MNSSNLMLYLSKKLEHHSKNISKNKQNFLCIPNEDNFLIRQKFLNNFLGELEDDLKQASYAIKALLSEINNLTLINQELAKKFDQNILTYETVKQDQSDISQYQSEMKNKTLKSMKNAKDVIVENKKQKSKIRDAVKRYFSNEKKRNTPAVRNKTSNSSIFHTTNERNDDSYNQNNLTDWNYSRKKSPTKRPKSQTPRRNLVNKKEDANKKMPSMAYTINEQRRKKMNY